MTMLSAKRNRFYRVITILSSITISFSSIHIQAWGAYPDVSRETSTQSSAFALPITPTDLEVTRGLADDPGVDRRNALAEVSNLGAGNALHPVASGDTSSKTATATKEPLFDYSAQPLSISHSQSTYMASATLSNVVVITFTIANNQPPTMIHQLPISTSITDTMAALSIIRSNDDPNTIHQALLVDVLTKNVNLVSSSIGPDHRASQHVWNLGDIPPLSTKTISLTLITSGDGSLNPDVGATVWGTLQGHLIKAQAKPIGLLPSTIDNTPTADWLKWTVDADKYNQYLLAAIEELNQDPERLFEYMQSLGYESYTGSLRGTLGTLWSQAGNSLDKASLLIAMLRADGVPARYRHGTLSVDHAQELILSMFSSPSQVIGHLPSDVELSDPANNPQLIAETRDHWWVEAYLPNLGWRNLDPSFAEAHIGQSFVEEEALANDSTDRIAEVPDHFRHKVTIRLKTERYDPLGSLSGNLAVMYPLSITMSTVEVVGKPVTLGHLVNSNMGIGMTFWHAQHTYVPYIVIGDSKTSIEGQSFQDFISNFPFSNHLTTGEWLIFDVYDANGNVNHYEREVVDKIGYEARQTGGVITAQFDKSAGPILTEYDLLTIVFAPSLVPSHADPLVDMTTSALKMLAAKHDLDSFPAGTAQQTEALGQLSGSVKQASLDLSYGLGARVYGLLDTADHIISQRTIAKLYPDTPRIIIVSQQYHSGTLRVDVDLQTIHERVIPFPRQASDIEMAARYQHGLMATLIEGKVLEEISNDSSSSVSALLAQSQEQNIPLVLINSQSLDLLRALELSPEAKARITVSALKGNSVFVPSKMMGINNSPTIGWMEISSNGDTIGVMENGLHDSFIEWANIQIFNISGDTDTSAFISGYAMSLYDWIVTAAKNWLAEQGSNLVCWAPDGRERLLGCARVTQGLISGLLGFVPRFGSAVPVSLINSVLNAVLGMVTQIWEIPLDQLDLGKSAIMANLLAEFAQVTAHLIQTLTAVVEMPSKTAFAFGAGSIVGYISGFLYWISSVIYYNHFDPPLPPYVIGNETLARSARKRVSTRLQGSEPTNTSFEIRGDIAARHVVLSGPSQSTWCSLAFNTFRLTSLYSLEALIFDDEGQPIGHGGVKTATIISNIEVKNTSVGLTLSSIGSASFYAPAISGLGVGSNWITYTAQLTSTQPYTLELRDVVVTVNGTATYTGSFTLVTTDTTYIEGSGHTAVPNFADAAYMQADDAHLMIGPATGTFMVGNEPVDASNGLAIAGYTGPITISEETAALDRIELNGDASFFTLATVPTSTIAPAGGGAVNFQAQIAANFSDTYTTTVEAPQGWNVELDASGLITATPPLGAEPGDYTILVTAQSGTYPDLFASAVHTVTTAAYQGMALNVNPDTLITVPFGPGDPTALPGDTNNGQIQIPGAAFTIDITNTSTTSHTFAIDVNDLPDGWLILSGAEGQTTTTLTLPAGGIGQIGLYISPTLSALPPAHTEYPFTVNAVATDNPSLSQSDADVFTVPEIAFSQVKTNPAAVYSSPGLTTTFDVGLRNVGNTGGAFPLIVTQPISTWTAAINSPLAVDAGQVLTQNVVLNTPAGEIGRDYNVNIAAPSGAYTQTANVNVQLVGPCVLQVQRATQLAEQVSGSEGSLGLVAAWHNLTFQLSEFELKPGQAVQRQRVISATQSVIDQFSNTFPISTAGLQAVVADLADNTTAAEDSATVAAYCAPVTDVIDQLERLTDRAASIVVQPGTATTLTDLPITYTVRLLNRGTLATTYDLAVEGLDPAWLSSLTGSIALEPGQIGTWSFTATPTALGTHPFTVTVTAQEDALVQYHTRAMLRAVDAFVKVLEVAAYPDFVDTGLSHTNLSMQLANQAELSQPALAQVQVTAPDSTSVLTSSVPITLSPYDRQIRTIDLGALDTSHFITGVYTIGVTVTDLSGRLIPYGSGFGKLSVGQAISATARVEPQIVAPGNPIVTTTIEAYLPGSLRMDLHWTRSVETDTISAASIGNAADLNRALALPTYSDLVWDNGAIAYGDSASVPPGHLWASWWQRYGIDMRHFRGTFTLPVGRNITITDGILASPYYQPDMVLINDNVYIYLNGTLQFSGGTDYPGTPRGVVPETDYWYIPTGARLNGIHEGENVIDIVTEERNGWGGLGYLELTLLQPLGDVRYQVDTLHQIPVSGIQVLTETVTPPAVVEPTAETNDYLWQHELSPTQRLQTITFASQLPAMQPGEIRQVSADTIVSYTVASGSNQLHLGPLYVVAPHIIQLDPSSQVVAPGGHVTYAVTLYNPALYTDTFKLSVSGLPEEWVSIPAKVTLGAGLSQTVTLTVQPSPSVEASEWSFGVVADTGSGGRESAQAELNVRTALQVAIQPELLAAGNHQTVTYTVSITNAEATFHTYSLTVAGLTENVFTLPETIGIAPHTVMTVPLAVTAHAPQGWYPFEVQAEYASGNGLLSAADEAVLIVASDVDVNATLSPVVGTGGPSVPVLYHLTVTNTGSLSDTYSFNVNLPAGWTYRLEANGMPITTLSLTPYVFNAAELWLIVTPALDAVPDAYDFDVHVQSLNETRAQVLVNGVLDVTERGVQVSVIPEHTMLNPTDTGTWQVQVTNTGAIADTFDLMAGGIVSGSAQFTPASVSLAPGESQTVQLTSRDMDFALPQTYPFAVTAQSTADAHIQNFDTADIAFSGYEAVQVELQPVAQTITDSLQASYLMVITNTGNIDTIYRFSTVAPGLASQWEVNEVYIPAHMTAGVLLTVRASGSGTYAINAIATSMTSPAQDSATASLTVIFTNQPPIVNAGTDQTANEGDAVLFNGSFTDADTGDMHTIQWNFGDGATTGGTLTPTHTYVDNGVYTVTLTITDNAGSVGQDTLRVTVNNVVPVVNAGLDQTAAEGESVHFTGAFTDVGTADTHSLAWNFGDGSTATGVLTPTHIYVDNGAYTATLTVTDKDGGIGTDTLLIVVGNVAPLVDAGPDRVTVEGASLQFTGSFTDPGTADTHLIAWDFGDGGMATGSLTPTHTYTQSGIYTATLTITDDDGGMGNDALAVTVQPGATSCTTMTIQSEGVTDAYIWSAFPDANYNYDRLYTGKVEDGYKRSLLRFDLGSLPTNTTIERATFSLNQFANGNATPVEAHRIISGWIEDEVTWSGFDNAYDPNLLGSWLPEANGWYSLEVTSLVQAWVDGTWSNHGLLLDQPAGDGHTEYRATEYEDEEADRPKLTICYRSGPALPAADFSAAPVSGAAPLTVTFVNQSTPLGAITAYLWNFGDGTPVSTEQAPTHLYTETGTYTVTLQITVEGQTYQKTREAYINVTNFPTTSVLDDFDRSDGGMGSNWSGGTAIYGIVSNQVAVQSGSEGLFWNATAYGADQEAFVTLTNVDPNGHEQDLVLKSQSNSGYTEGLLQVIYDAPNHQVTVDTYDATQGWVRHGEGIPVTFVNGDQFGARARANGIIEVYRNGTLLATRDVTSWPYYASGGYIGLWFCYAAAVFDDFGGGSVNTTPVANFVAAPIAGEAPLTVTFTNRSALPSAITSYLWTFGDGITSTTAQPVHVYSTAGHFTVTLTVFGATTQDTLTRSRYIDVITPASFPSAMVLDDFDRSDGGMGSNWSGATSMYGIVSHQVAVQSGNGGLFWNATAYGADQEAFVTLTNVDADGGDQALVLKAQASNGYGEGGLEVWYDPPNHQVLVETYDSTQDWVRYGEGIPVTLVNGDQLGARAYADGTVEVYRNGALLATRDVTSWPYYANGGYVGLWFIDAATAVLDDFGGATTGSTAPTPDLVAFWDDFDPVRETWTHNAAQGTDDWQLATDYAHSTSHAYYTSDPDGLKDDRLQTHSFVVPANGQLTFWQTYNLENLCDGGVLEISTDGGATFNDLGAFILSGGYTGILTCSTNPIRTRPAWTGGELGTMSQVTVDLIAFAGQTALLRFRLVADDGAGGGGWYIDDVRIQGTQVAEIIPLPGLNTLLAGVLADFYRIASVQGSDRSSLTSRYVVANNQLDVQARHGAPMTNE